MKPRGCVGVTVIVMLLAIAAPAGATTARTKSGCSLLKKSDVEKVLAEQVKKGAKPPAPPATLVCGYDVLGGVGRSVNVWVQRDGGDFAYKTAKTTFKDDVEKVSGFGKKSFYVGGGLNTLYVLKGDTLVYVQYVALDVDDAAAIKDAVTRLTKIVVKRT